MKRTLKKYLSILMILALTAPVVKYALEDALAVEATTIDRTKENIDRLNEEINKLNERIGNMEEEQDILEEEMEDLNAEIINTLTSISMKEDEIAETELEIEQKNSDIEDTEAEYEKAKEQEEQQYADMVVRLRKMYENGETSGLELLLSGTGLADMLNRMDYVESIYEYDRNMLEQYETTKNQVLELWNQLEADKLELETTKDNLVLAQEDLKTQKVELDGLLAKKKQQSANYDAEIKKARQEASVAKKKLQQEQQTLKKLQAGGGGNAANGTYTTDYNALIDAAGGSELGKQIAKYACQYIGNPYVAGGTSLTNGADCSGFTYRVYSDFGYRLPRTSTEQRSAGTGVNYSDAQPGDLICYSGHVALYIGGGKIVHASTQKTGIKVGNAEYRTILAVRRII
ncbi:MAG: C40 family peptidase [Acetatifactor sp.]|nr:C40 family peptidase [Acetatifactor sp.]